LSGGIVEQKRPRVAAEIISQLTAQVPDFVCLVAGDGDMLPFLREFIKKHNLGTHVRLIGAIEATRYGN